MIYILLVIWIACAFFMVRERKIVRLIIQLAIFSLISSACFLLFAAPDVAMAEAVISAFSTIIFIVSFEKYYTLVDFSAVKKQAADFPKKLLSLGFVAFLFVLFIYFAPDASADPHLKNQYTSMFYEDVGGINAVSAIYLGYRMYDTLFEALMLLVSSVAVVHLSMHHEHPAPGWKHMDINNSEISVFTIRIICIPLIMFGIYLIMNGHISPGGGFQGGVVLASAFMCRYMIYAIYDIRINWVVMLEKFVFAGIVLLASFFIFLDGYSYLPIPQTLYLILMNLLIGIKVACGFLIIFYRFVTFEWR